MVRVGIAGVSGYTGAELLRLVGGHPELEVTWVGGGASAGQAVAASWPALVGLTELVIEPVEPERIAERCDVCFLALPHGWRPVGRT